MKLTREAAIKECRKLWTEIAEKELNSKHDVMTVDVIKYLHNCPLCQWVEDITGETPHSLTVKLCKKICPLDWPNGHCCPQGGDGLYVSWENSRDPKIAAKIAALPVKSYKPWKKGDPIE